MRKKTKMNVGVTSGGADNIPGVASLPEEIIFDILTMLPVRSLVRFRCVSKSWNSLLKTSASFAKLQADYSLKNRPDGIFIALYEKICYLDYDSLISSSDSSTLHNKLVHIAYPLEYKKNEIVGSSNGLVCYTSSYGGIIIWNPLTKEYKKIPELPIDSSLPINSSLHYGFGYDSKTEDYKLAGYRGIRRNDHIYLYSLKFNSWRKITITPLEWPYGSLVFFEGFFHWEGNYFPGPQPKPKETSCFDIANETVKHILLPKHFPKKFTSVRVCLLGGRLCLTARDANYNICEVWTMKDYGTVEDYWTKMFANYKVKSVSLSKNNKMNCLRLHRSEYSKQTFKNSSILVYHDYTSTYLYDINSQVFKKLEIDNILEWRRTWAFCGSLVSPNIST